MRYRAVLGMMAGVGLLAGCGSADLGVESSGAVAASTVAPTTASTAAPTTTVPVTTAAPPRTAPSNPDSTDVADSVVVTTPDGGTVYVDPDGLYSMTIGSDWDELGMFRGAQAWTIGHSGGFGANVNVLVQPYTLGLPRYVETGLVGADMVIDELEVLRQEVTTGAQDQPIGLIEYLGTLGTVRLHFLSVVVVTPDNAVLATFAAEAEGFESIRDDVEPYLLTLALVD